LRLDGKSNPIQDSSIPLSGGTAGAMSGAAAWARTHRADIGALLLHALASVLFFWRIAVLGMVPAGYDLVTYFYPYKALLSEMVRRGEMPLWNPSIFMGAPLLANIQAAVFYPPDVLFYLMPTTEALRVSVLLHVFLAAAFSYLFARMTLSLSPLAAWVCGAVFAYGGFIGAQVGHLNQLHAAVWLPLMLLCLERAVSRRSVTAVALGAVALACQILAGHTQEVYYSCVAVGLLTLYLSVLGRGDGLRSRLLPLGAMVATVLVGVGAAAVQLLPTIELAGQSYRSGGMPFGEAVTYAVQLRDLLDSLLPLYTMLPYVELTGYTGLISLALLPAALATRRPDRLHWFFATLASLALLLSLGDRTPLYPILFRLAPGFDLFRAPGRWLFLYSLSLAALSGIGLDAILRRRSAQEWLDWVGRYGMVMAAGLAAFALLRVGMGMRGEEFGLPPGRLVVTWALLLGAGVALSLAALSRRASLPAPLLLVALLMADLYVAREPMEYNRPLDGSVYTAQRTSTAPLATLPPARVLSLAGDSYKLEDDAALRAQFSGRLSSDGVSNLLSFTRLREVAAPNTGMISGLPTLDGYDGGLLPTQRFAQLKQALMGSSEYKPDLPMREVKGPVPSSRTLAAFGVGYLLVGTDRGAADDGWEGIGAEGGPLRLLRNRNLLPRAFVVHQVQSYADEGQLLGAIGQTDLSRVALLSEELHFDGVESPGDETVTLSADGAGSLDITTALRSPGLLVLSDSYYPGWKAYVDGVESRILRADFAIRAVQLSAGTHTVHFVYDPLTFKVGAAISVLGVFAVVAMLAAGWRRRRRP
jgi:hypothetical protein